MWAEVGIRHRPSQESKQCLSNPYSRALIADRVHIYIYQLTKHITKRNILFKPNFSLTLVISYGLLQCRSLIILNKSCLITKLDLHSHPSSAHISTLHINSSSNMASKLFIFCIQKERQSFGKETISRMP